MSSHFQELVNLRVDGITVHVEGTTNGLKERETADVGKLGVVLDGETARDDGELGEGDVGQGVVVVDGKSAANVSEVRGLHALEEVAVETEGAVDGGERREHDAGAVGNVESVGPDQVGKAERDVAAVGEKLEDVANIAQLHGDIVKVLVVLDGDTLDGLEVNALKAAQLGVDDADGGGLLDPVGERKTLETRKTVPVNLLNLVELREVEVRENLVPLEVEGAVDGLEAVGGDRGDLANVVGDQVTSDSPDAVELDVLGGAGGNGDAAGEGGA